jgi:hypothetical protein
MKKSIPTVLGDKKSCLTVADEKEYGKLVKQTKVFWKYLDEQIALRPWCSLVKAEKSDGVRLRTPIPQVNSRNGIIHLYYMD